MTGKASILAILGLAALGMVQAAPLRKAPDDFKLVATYSAGFSIWKQWETTITADGQAVQEIKPGRKGGEEERKTSKLFPDDVEALRKAVKDADFAKLKDHYRAGATDQPTLILEVTDGETTHKVEVYGPNLIKDNRPEVDRFLRVYAEVLRKVPSPNSEQTPELYEPKK